MRAADDVSAVWTARDGTPLLFTRIKGALIEACWTQLRPFVVEACARSHGRFTPMWAAQRLADHTDQLWALIDASGVARGVVTTHLGRYPTGLRVLEIILIGGRDIGRANARAIWAALQTYRDLQDCTRIEWQGRKGISRWLGLSGVRAIGALCEV